MASWATKGIAVCAALLGALAVAPPSSRSQTAALEDFGGSWQFTRSARDTRSLEDGIDHVADQLNLFIREIARGEMRRRIQPEGRVRFRIESETRVAISIDEWGPLSFDLGSAPRRVRGSEGDDIRAGLSFRQGRIYQREVHDQGHRTNVFSLSPDATHMTMSATIGSNQLPDEIRYRLTYRRLR
ncbi:MAG: hypothetical protein H6719_09580 [Sandaracinaceae bacterium]|nr:hypothetical protein [Sandaracinaceae bacterium]